MSGEPKIPPVPLRRGFVVALVLVVSLFVLPFGVAILLESGPDLRIEPVARGALALAILGSPVIAVVTGKRRHMAMSVTIVTAAGIAAASCVAGLFVATEAAGGTQVGLAGVIAGASVYGAASVRPRSGPGADLSQLTTPRRPDDLT